ncbi:MAG: hypothetical protein ACQEXX_01770 [Bacillota bacterium]
MWEFNKTNIVGYGRLYDSKGKAYNVEYSRDGEIKVTTIKQNKIVKIPAKVEKMILEKIQQ